MDLKSRNKINTSFSMSSMTDIIFLLLIFFMLTSTLIAPNALKLLLPKSNNQTDATPVVSVSITEDLQYYIGQKRVEYMNLETMLHQKLRKEEDPVISLHADKNVPINEVVKVMNIAKNNRYKLILATRPE
jgi:biopolymer transport protein ExbD